MCCSVVQGFKGCLGRLQVLTTPFEVWLEMAAFAPFVPGIDKNNSFFERELADSLPGCFGQPRFIELRRRPNINLSAHSPACSVIPHRGHASEALETGVRF